MCLGRATKSPTFKAMMNGCAYAPFTSDYPESCFTDSPSGKKAALVLSLLMVVFYRKSGNVMFARDSDGVLFIVFDLSSFYAVANVQEPIFTNKWVQFFERTVFGDSV